MPSDVRGAYVIVEEVLTGLRPLEDLGLALPKMRRDKSLQQARVKRNKVTKEIRDAVKRDLAAYAARGETINRDDMGRRHNVAGGRISEIDKGQHDHL